jgi:hypothetical protein
LLDTKEAPLTNFDPAVKGDFMEYGGKKLTFKGQLRDTKETKGNATDLFPSCHFEFADAASGIT